MSDEIFYLQNFLTVYEMEFPSSLMSFIHHVFFYPLKLMIWYIRENNLQLQYTNYMCNKWTLTITCQCTNNVYPTSITKWFHDRTWIVEVPHIHMNINQYILATTQSHLFSKRISQYVKIPVSHLYKWHKLS